MDLLKDLQSPLWKTKNVIYCYTNKINNKVYIGQTIQQLKKRHQNHINDSKNEKRKGNYNTHFHASLRKYGIENFSLEIIHFGKTLDELNYFEIFFIKKYKSLNKEMGYNSASGGSNGWSCANKTEEEMNEIYEKQRKRMSGENNPNYGKKGEEHPFYGKHHTDECKKRQSELMKGENNPMYNVKGALHYESKKIKQYDLDGNLIKIWDCLTDVERELKIPCSSISKVANRKSRSAGGFVWRFLDDSFDYTDYKKEKMKKVCKYSKDGELIEVYDSIKEASIENNLYLSAISKCCVFWEMECNKEEWFKNHTTNPIKTSGGFIWKYFKE